MSGHVRVGHAIVAAAELEEEARWVLHHHEHVDGSGYPDGLRGDEIPLESRIILVADAFEAITADRPYSAPARPTMRSPSSSATPAHSSTRSASRRSARPSAEIFQEPLKSKPPDADKGSEHE